MKLIRYLRMPVVDVTDDCCIHLEEHTRVHIVSEEASVWLESFEPARIVGLISRLQKPVLNSLWLEERYFAAYSDLLCSFDEIVLVPYDPEAKEKPYEVNLQRILDMAKAYDIPHHSIIVDLSIVPYAKCSDLRLYSKRLASIQQAGFKTVAAFDNMIHRTPDKLTLLRKLREELENKLTYALIRDRYYDELNHCT